MATFFGEVVQQSSRAFWDGCEDDVDYDTDTMPVFQLKKLENIEDENYDLIIFSCDKVSTEFALSCFLLDKIKVIVTIHEIEQNRPKVEKQQKQVAELFKITNKILLLTCTSDIHLRNANDLLQLVTQWLCKSKEAIVLAASPISEYKGLKCGKIPQSSFVRSLKTRTYKEVDELCPRLEIPNAISGFSAAVLSWCQVKDMPCVLYIYYYITSFPINNIIDIRPWYKLLQRLPWYKQYCSGNKKIDEAKSIKLHNHVFENSNLYL